MRIRSFDVFDTVLTRSVAAPTDLFVVLGTEMVAAGVFKGSPVQFAQTRLVSENTAREKVPGGEVRFDEIYAEMRDQLGWNGEQASRCSEAELLLEARSLRAVPGAAAMLAEARLESGSIWFISDMYLPGRFVESVLRREGLFSNGDRLLLSGEQRASKHAGTLFGKVRELAGKPVESWLHVGDNLHADVEIPGRLGVSGRWYPNARLTSRELQLRGRDQFVPEWRSRTAAACRLTRLERDPQLEPDKIPIWESSTVLAGPVIFAYVWWCLQRAKEMGLRRLYFVARDGQILNRIASRLVSEWKLPLETRYLYGSRQAWHLAGITSLDSASLEAWLYQGGRNLTLRRLLRRLGLGPEGFLPSLEVAGFPRQSWDGPLGTAGLQSARAWLAWPEVSRRVLEMAAEKRSLLGDYLQQEGVFESETFGVVDIGWHGNMQKSLSNSLLALGKAVSFAGFYFGLVRPVAPVDGQPVRAMWNELFGNTFPVELTYLSELFMAADHGTVLGYRRDDTGRVVPILDGDVNVSAVAWGLTIHQMAVSTLAEHLANLLSDHSDALADFAGAMLGFFESAYRNPAASEAACWGRLPFSTDQAEANFRVLIPASKYAQRVLRAWFPRMRPEAWWIEGANKLHPCLPVSLFLVCRALKRRFL